MDLSPRFCHSHVPNTRTLASSGTGIQTHWRLETHLLLKHFYVPVLSMVHKQQKIKHTHVFTWLHSSLSRGLIIAGDLGKMRASLFHAETKFKICVSSPGLFVFPALSTWAFILWIAFCPLHCSSSIPLRIHHGSQLFFFSIAATDSCRWQLTTVILDTWEADIGRITGQAGQILHEIPSPK